MSPLRTTEQGRKAVPSDAAAESSFLKAVLESTADGLLAVGLDGTFTGYNHKFIQMWDLPDELVGKGKNDGAALQHVLDKVKDPERFIARVRDLYARTQAVSFDRFELRDGRVFERYSQPQVQDGQIVGRVWSFRDVTERTTAEVAQRSSEERLRMAIIASQMGIWDWNIATGEVLWCENVDKVLGVDPAETPHSLDAYRALVAAEDLQKVNQAFEDILKGKIHSYRLEHRIRPPNRDPRWVEVWGRAKCALDGAPLHLYGAILDITAAKEKEQQILSLNHECELKVKERTRQLEEAYHDLEAFSYSVSHDLRAPVRHINAFLEMLLIDRDQLHQDVLKKLEVIQAASQRLTGMFEGLLKFAKLGHKALSHTALDLNQLLDELKQEFSPETLGRQILWQIHPLPTIAADPDLIRTAFYNLISNALKFTRDRESAHIEIGCLPADHEPGKVVLFVRDDGIGFDMSQSRQLFGVFHRLESARPFEGSGVGLANVRRIIERHSGRIWAEASPDRGATFYFTLPAQSAPPALPSL